MWNNTLFKPVNEVISNIVIGDFISPFSIVTEYKELVIYKKGDLLSFSFRGINIRLDSHICLVSVGGYVLCLSMVELWRKKGASELQWWTYSYKENINPLSTLNTTYRTVITISLGIKPFYEIGKAIFKLQPLLKHPHLEINSRPAHMRTQPTAKGKHKQIK